MIKVNNIERVENDKWSQLSAFISSDDGRFENDHLWFRYPPAYYDKLSQTANPFVAALLLPAMRLGLTLRIEGVISKKLHQNIKQFMEIVHQWWPRFTPVEIQADSTEENSYIAKSVGLFFTGGVDSFYSLLKNENSEIPSEDKITHLMFVKGFDIDLDDVELANKAVETVCAIAAKLGKEAIIVSSNYRKVIDRFAPWNVLFGAALMSVAFGIESLFKTVYIAAPHTYTDLQVYEGSHPTLDHLWSTESIEVIHDGCEATRVEKVVNQIAKSQVALDHLRVCWENRYGRYNCGECEKCIRTMVGLEVAGALSKCKTFESKLDYKRIARLYITDRHAKLFLKENYDALAALGSNPRLLKVLSKCLSPLAEWRPRNLAKRLFDGVKHLVKDIDQKSFQGRLQKWYSKRQGINKK